MWHCKLSTCDADEEAINKLIVDFVEGVGRVITSVTLCHTLYHYEELLL